MSNNNKEVSGTLQRAIGESQENKIRAMNKS